MKNEFENKRVIAVVFENENQVHYFESEIAVKRFDFVIVTFANEEKIGHVVDTYHSLFIDYSVNTLGKITHLKQMTFNDVHPNATLSLVLGKTFFTWAFKEKTYNEFKYVIHLHHDKGIHFTQEDSISFDDLQYILDAYKNHDEVNERFVEDVLFEYNQLRMIFDGLELDLSVYFDTFNDHAVTIHFDKEAVNALFIFLTFVFNQSNQKAAQQLVEKGILKI